MAPNLVYLLIGSNLGDREHNLKIALEHLKEYNIIISKTSSIHNTSPWGFKDQPDFLNQAIEAFTTLEPYDLLKKLKNIEKQMGRIKSLKYGPRIIDIDIIFYNDLILESEELSIPHPLMHMRDFVLKPLYEIAPDFIHPKLNLSVRDLLINLKDFHNH